MQPINLGKRSLFWMASEKGMIHTTLLLGSLFTLIPAVISTKGSINPAEFGPLLVIISLVICMATLVNTDFGLSILVFSMLLSPEVEAAHLPSRAVTIRIEDFLIIIVFFTWLAKMAIFKTGLIRRSLLNQAVLLYVVSVTFSTLLAWQQGRLNGYGSYFYLLKYIEYFVVFFMFFNNVRSKEQVQRFLVYFLITGLCVCIYVLSTIGKYARLGAPFEGDQPEPGSLGGYLLVLMSVLFGLLLYSDWPRHRLIPVGLLILAIVTLIFSTSRGALIAFIPLYLAAVYLSPRRRVLLVGVFLCALLFGYYFVPPHVIQWTLQAFQASAGGKAYSVGGRHVELGPSAVARVESVQYVFYLWKQKPIFGYGALGVGIVDSQLVRILGETGVIGLSIFVYLLILIFKGAFKTFESTDPFIKGLGMALVLTNTALIAQSTSANSYIIVRIMEPFWFLVAITLGMSQLEEEALEKKEDTGKLRVA